MTLLTVRLPADEATLAAVSGPRDDGLVAERAVPVTPGEQGPIHAFEGVDGPFERWRREVSVDGQTITQTFSFELAIPLWGVCFVPAVKGLLRGEARRLQQRSVSIDSGQVHADEPVEPRASPWWSPPDRLDATAARTLASACTLAVIGGYLGALLGQTLTFVADDLGGGVGSQSWVLSVARIGALGTAVGMWLADRRGRRPLIVGSYVVAAVAAAAGAGVSSLGMLSVTQLVCRGAVATGALLLPVTAAEELPAGSRAFGIGLVTMSGGLGVGVLTISLSVLDFAPWAWRVLYAVALLAIPATFAAARHLGESRRFLDVEAATATTGGPASDSHHMKGRRLALMGLALFFLWVFLTPVAQLQNDYLNNDRGFSASTIAFFLVVTNVWGGVGVVVGGRLADRRSRHLVSGIGLAGLAIGNAIMFSVAGPGMWVASALGSLLGAATVPSVGVLSPELFPTSRRGTANGLLNLAAVVGSVTGLLVAGWAVEQFGYGSTITVMAISPLIVILVLRWVPETARRELEEINP